MPKYKAKTVLKWIENEPDMTYDGNKSIFCAKCKTKVTTKKSNVQRHIKGPMHNGNYRKFDEDFNLNLIRFLILCNIPWSQMKNPAFKQFFSKYLCCQCANQPTLPSESWLRKVYLDKLYQKQISSIHDNLSNEKIWISLDETTDSLGRYIVHFLVKPLNSFNRPYLIACKILSKVNGQTISVFVMDTLKNMWGESYDYKIGNVLVLSTDGVAYMLLSGRILKTYLPNLKHVTCLAHGLNRVAEKIRSLYPDVDLLISNVKKVFLKAPNRIRILKDKYPNMPLPPKPVITRWGTWLAAAAYYEKYFDEIKVVLWALRSSDAMSIRVAKRIIQTENLRNNLKYIVENFHIIEYALKKLQESKISVVDTFLTLDQVRAVISWSSSASVSQKLEDVIARNPDLDLFRDYAEKISEGTDVDGILMYNFTPLTSVEVERSFSIYKWILNSRRSALKIENLEKIIVLYYNNQ